MRAIDTNALVRIIAGDDPRQRAIALQAIAAGAWVSHVVLIEAIWVLKSHYQRGRAEIDKIVEVLIDHDTLVLQDVETVRAALAVFRVAKKVEFPDCLILESARKAGHIPLCTFDRALAKLEGAQHVNDV